jgi:hypothetical protein
MNNNSHHIQTFINRWQASGAAERANYQLFLTELCDIIGVDHPRPASEKPHENEYIFEKSVPSAHGTTNFIDLYKRSCFVLEAKQGSEKPETDTPVFSEADLIRRKQRKTGTAVRGTKGWDTAMEKARQQAQTYARSLPSEEIQGGRPPFIVIVDVGNTIALYSEFSRTGGNYIPFPDPSSYRLKLDDLHDGNVRQLLHQVWNDPMGLDPSRRSAKVTREIAARLAELAKSLEGSSDPESVAHFLMRCLFTMFAEDVGMLPERSFTQLLDDIRQDPASFQPMLEHLWKTMDQGGFSVILRRHIPRFNGGLFTNQTALPLSLAQIELLVEAAKADWRDVEPAIFGTLLERALDPVERHKLGAHYTPRAYVERLVKPTIVEPLRAEWESVQAAALLQAESGKPADAIAEIETFHRHLATIRILDPACGSGNFLYVTLEHLKRLEGEVLNTLQELGEGQLKLEMSGVTVSPQQFLGIEVNPRAAAIAELVLWIGYLQWHYRTRGDTPHAEPIIKDFHNIECRDAVLAWDSIEPLLDEKGVPVTRWDGRTTKTHPVTGEEVPDETARIPAYKYISPCEATWPSADFIVGNPPFIGNKRMRFALGDGYVDALRSVYKKVPNSVDFVMYWWEKAALLLHKNLERFGFVTTNSITQTFNRRILKNHITAKKTISIVYAIPDHPWVDSADGAAVRIAMTVAKKGTHDGILAKVRSEKNTGIEEVAVEFDLAVGNIYEDLKIGANVAAASYLRSNEGMSFQGIILVGDGFRLSPEELDKYGLNANQLPEVVHKYMIGHDLTQTPKERFVIDFYGLTAEEAQKKYPQLMQKLINDVKPFRDINNDPTFREKWWVWGRPRPDMRNCFSNLSRYIATCRTATHRTFIFLNTDVMPDAKIIAIGLDDAFYLGILSSWVHILWARASGGWLGVGNDSNYNHSDCFGKFPFPDANEAQKARIRTLAEQIDTHRKRQQAQYPKLTITDMYNVMEKLHTGEALDAKERIIHEQGLISVLQQLHDDLDQAVFEAYGWPSSVSDEEILQRLVGLNAKRAAEEDEGHIRWLRPEYQAADQAKPIQPTLVEVPETDAPPVILEVKQVWPSSLKDRATAVRAVLTALGGPVGAEDVASGFDGRRTPKRVDEVSEILEMLLALGQIAEQNGKYVFMK